jgi:tRNA-modifying protein YgfZ
MRSAWRVVTDLGLGVLRARGVDAGSFLQGQLSNDTSQLRWGQWQLSGYHTPQGRTIALLRLTELAPGDLLAVLPLELIPVVVGRLQRYVLRAKVQLTDDSSQWQIWGFQGEAPVLPQGAVSAPYGNSRHLALIPTPAGTAAAGVSVGTRSDWLACDIREGLPQVYLATSEDFVAQMLNLDVIGGIALTKGCYTGQEIIARAHYRGHVKRRMQRFTSEVPCTLQPGQTGVLGDGRGFKVVESVSVDGGHCEFLAVTNPTPAEDIDAGAATIQITLTARQLELPYALPLAV